MHILLADDDESILMVARLGLRRAGFTVTMVEDGSSALKVARETSFDVVILDWSMPDVDGIDVCRQLMADPEWPRVPILFLTAAAHEGVEQEALAAGARGVIFKPFDPMRLGAMVTAHLQGSADCAPQEAVRRPATPAGESCPGPHPSPPARRSGR